MLGMNWDDDFDLHESHDFDDQPPEIEEGDEENFDEEHYDEEEYNRDVMLAQQEHEELDTSWNDHYADSDLWDEY